MAGRLRRRSRIGGWAQVALVGILALAAPGIGPVSPAARSVGTGDQEQVDRRAPAPPVRVNRVQPKVTPPRSDVTFSATPTDEEIFRARIFAEPLVPIGGATSGAENRALAQAIMAARARPRTAEATAAFEEFLAAFPGSPWRASLLVNLGRVRREEGRFSRALALWDEAWRLTQADASPRGRAVADDAMAETVRFLSTLGLTEALEDRLAEAGDRAFRGSAGGTVQTARTTLAVLRRHPEAMVSCGRQALALLWPLLYGDTAVPPVLAQPDGQGAMTLGEVQALAQSVGLDLEMVVRPAGAALVTPAIVHLNLGHYAVLAGVEADRSVLRDPGLGGAVGLTRAAVDEELSGYMLVPRGRRPAGWRGVGAEEAAQVVGRSVCPPGAPDPNEPPCPTVGGSSPEGSPTAGGSGSGGDCGATCGSSRGMVTYAFRPVNASLVLTDTPVGYAPPRGPAVFFTLRYDHGQTLQPQIPWYGHLGPQWTHDWLAWAQEMPAWCEGGLGPTNYCYPDAVYVYLRGGGQEIVDSPDAAGVYPIHGRVRAQLVRVATEPIRYERRLPDGGVEVFGLADAAPAGSRRVFLTEVRDAHGQAVTLTYDAAYRLVALTDAVGQVTTVAYTDPVDALRVTAITDPFGRQATLTYTAEGQVATITDVVGLTSALAYLDGDFVSALTTTYGTTTFRRGTDFYAPAIEATDPLGATEHLEFRWEEAGVPASAPAGEVPAGFASANSDLHRYTTVYWDRRAWARAAGDVAAATVTHWLLDAWRTQQVFSVAAAHSVQRAGERRVWMAYPGQGTPASVGWIRQPSRVGRVLADGTSQVTEAAYNSLGSVTSRTDPVGRTTTYAYAANGRDLLEVRQTTGGANDLLARYADYTAGGRPQTVTDAAGQTTTLTYTAAGQVRTATNAREETTTYAYDDDGRLTAVTGPLPGATTTSTYDGYGRVRTVTQDGATVTTDYDALDRVTRVTYPDGTFEATTYDRLDVAARTDRLGRVTRYFHDATRRLVATRDAAGRVVRHVYGAAADQLVDANGQTTTWERDVAGRVTREVRADGVTATPYTYDVTGRLATVTDPKGQVTTYTYGLDDSVSTITFSNAVIATPGVAYAYDPVYPRVTTMTDGTGVTAYTYHPAGQLGAGQVATVDGPLPDDAISYTYDALGRVVERAIAGVPLTLAYDALGRVTQEVNALGTFGYGYDGVSGRLAFDVAQGTPSGVEGWRR